jgi:2-polyprenyl-6-methoxyphenol hydroxylase-like FAD-dependent oxidoreductase
MMNAEVTGLLEGGDRVAGVRASTPEGELDVRARVVLGADGRHSIVRRSAKTEVLGNASPMDVLWFRLSRRPGEELVSSGPAAATS